MRPLVAHCHLGLGTLYQKIGRDKQAQAELTTAAELYRAMEMPFWLAKAEAILAQVGSIYGRRPRGHADNRETSRFCTSGSTIPGTLSRLQVHHRTGRSLLLLALG
jgi:hypothetical protein